MLADAMRGHVRLASVSELTCPEINTHPMFETFRPQDIFHLQIATAATWFMGLLMSVILKQGDT